MKKATFTEKSIILRIPGYNSYQLTIESSYLNAIVYGAVAGLIAVFLCICTVLFHTL